jgi:hypothetical protein
MGNQSEDEKRYLNFITKYCQPDNAKFSRRRSITNPDTITSYVDTLLLDYELIDQEAIRRYLCSKPYPSYYCSTYWWYIISHKRKLMDGMKCSHEDCDGKCKILQVHHNDNYLHKGEEIKFMDTLRTYCETCHHTKIHEHEEKKTKKKGLFGFLNSKKNTEVIYAKTEENEHPEDPQLLKKFEEKFDTIFSQEIEITTDPKQHVIAVTTQTLTIEELQDAIFQNLDILLAALKK